MNIMQIDHMIKLMSTLLVIGQMDMLARKYLLVHIVMKIYYEELYKLISSMLISKTKRNY
jgi:hypothetical protein